MGHTGVNDRYQSVMGTPVGRILATRLGLPDPPRLERWSADSPVVTGTVVVGGAHTSPLVEPVQQQLAAIGVSPCAAPGLAPDQQIKAVVFDASGIADVDGLAALPEFFRPMVRRLEPCARVLVLGATPAAGTESARVVAQRALEGFTRSLAKEMRRGATVQLVLVAEAAHQQLASTLAFLLSPRSAYVSGQVVRVGSHGVPDSPATHDREQPLRGRVVLVTGAARGIGESMARVLHRDGATVISVDVAAQASALQTLSRAVEGDWIALDVTAADAPQRIARHLRDQHGGVDVVVHNAGITRDKRLASMRSDLWNPVLDINLGAPLRITEHLLDTGVLRPGGAVVGVSSIAGIAGNDGQTNYATSKAGIIGLVDALAEPAARQQVIVNAVAPGFIETQMTAAVPLLLREAGRRMNSLTQGGLPVDVAEAVGWLAAPGSAAVSGNVIRVCGQSLLGA